MGGRTEDGEGPELPVGSWEAVKGASGSDNRIGRGSGGGQAEESSGTPSGMQVQAGVLWGVM